MKKYKGSILLLITAIIWGTAFVSQSVGMDYVGPFTFNGLRFFIGGLVLIPFIFIFKDDTIKENKTNTLVAGVICGLLLFVASNLQQVGLQYTTVGKAGFITALYIILVPIFGIFFKRKPTKKLWFCVLLAIIGLYLLTMNGSFSLSFGDFLVLLCACVFALHIMVIDHYSCSVNGVKLSMIQFFVASILSFVLVFFFEEFRLPTTFDGYLPILYAGVLSSGVGYTLQIIGQKDTDPTLAAIIMSLESVFSVLAGWIILNQALSLKEIIGCIIMFIAIILAQLKENK